MKVSSTVYNFNQEKFVCYVAKVLDNTSVSWCITSFGCWAVLSTAALHLAHRKICFELIQQLLSNIGVIRHRNMSVFAPLQIISKISIGNCLLYITKSISNSDIGKCLHLGVSLPSNWSRYVISCLYWCVFYLSVSAFKLAAVLFTVLQAGRMETDVFW